MFLFLITIELIDGVTPAGAVMLDANAVQLEPSKRATPAAATESTEVNEPQITTSSVGKPSTSLTTPPASELASATQPVPEPRFTEKGEL